MLLKALRDYYLADTDVTNILGGRISPFSLPQDSSLPAADMRIVSGINDQTLTGLSGAVTAQVTFDCYAEDPVVADQLAEAMMYGGIVGHRWSSGSIFISGVNLAAGPTQSVEGVDPATDDRIYVTSFTLQVNFSRACR